MCCGVCSTIGIEYCSFKWCIFIVTLFSAELFIHFHLELLTQFPGGNDEKYFYLWKTCISNIIWFHYVAPGSHKHRHLKWMSDELHLTIRRNRKTCHETSNKRCRLPYFQTPNSFKPVYKIRVSQRSCEHVVLLIKFDMWFNVVAIIISRYSSWKIHTLI